MLIYCFWCIPLSLLISTPLFSFPLFLSQALSGDSAINPSLGRLVLQGLCPALHNLLTNGLKPHQSDLIAGRRPNSAWGLVQASTRPGSKYFPFIDSKIIFGCSMIRISPALSQPFPTHQSIHVDFSCLKCWIKKRKTGCRYRSTYGFTAVFCYSLLIPFCPVLYFKVQELRSCSTFKFRWEIYPSSDRANTGLMHSSLAYLSKYSLLYGSMTMCPCHQSNKYK